MQLNVQVASNQLSRQHQQMLTNPLLVDAIGGGSYHIEMEKIP